MKIILATGIYPPEIGGPATYVQHLSEELTKLGCKIKIVSYGQAGQQHPQLSIVNKNSSLLIRYFKYFWQVFNLCKWAEAVYILDLMSAGFPAIIAAKIRGKKVVFRTGGDFLWEKAFQNGWTKLPLVQYYEASKNFKEKLLLKFCGWLLKKIDAVVFSTKLQAAIYQKYYQLAEKKIKFIDNALPAINIRNVQDYNQDSIVFAGRLIKLKNLGSLINAFSRSNNNKVKLLIYGEGPEKKNLEHKISNLNLTGQVKLLGNIDHQKLLEAMAGCKFVILPSLTEISPNLVLECLSMGQPIIVTQETGFSDDIKEELITINPQSEADIKEKIDYLLEPNNLADYLSRLKKIKVENRSWQQVAQEHHQIFKSLLANEKGIVN
ncbi:glycosyltransferase family 4 protein [Patescibacteria group bacterium]|nr:glycosyltransferase family 4 protein [Patescibacteria group bacterium]